MLRTDKMYDLTEKFISVVAAPGREHKLAKLVMEMAEPYCDEMWVDAIGNVICKVNGTGENKKKILYSAHMDEVAMMVTYIEENGMIRFRNNGGPGYISAAYTDVRFENGVRGVLELNRAGSYDPQTMQIDIGAKSKEEAEKYVQVGDSFGTEHSMFRMCGTTVAGRPFDDRAGMAIIMQAMIDLKERGVRPYHEIYFAFSVQEETVWPAPGALVLANVIQPDIGIAIDGCVTTDMQGATPVNAYVGGGVGICASEAKLVTDKDLLDTMVRTCKKDGIPYTVYAEHYGGTDAMPMQTAGKGCKAGILAFPGKHWHTRTEVIDLADCVAVTDLVVALCDVEEFIMD